MTALSPETQQPPHEATDLVPAHRTCLPANAPQTDLNLFGLLRRYVGKDLSKVC